jgi:hypothetical protein
MDERKIIEQLERHFANADYILSNVFIWDWESDFFCITSSGYAIEVEVKISRSDFKADQKKSQKHFILQNAAKEIVAMPVHGWNGAKQYRDVKPLAPNKFFYCCPADLIQPGEVPEYAGLLWVKPDDYSGIKHVKSAKWLHKNKQDLSKKLLDKYYWLYINLKHSYRDLAYHAEQLRQTYDPKEELEINKKILAERKYYEPELFNLNDEQCQE